MARQWQEMFFENHLKAVPISGPDYIKLSGACGVSAIRVSDREDVMPAWRQAREHDSLFLIEFIVDPAPTSTQWSRRAALWPTPSKTRWL